MPWSLKPIHPPGPAIPLGSTPLRIGRGSDSTLKLDDPAVSRLHAEIRLENGRPVLVDLNSKGGTFLNHARTRQAELKNGDTIAFGRQQFQLVEEIPPAAKQASVQPGKRKPIGVWIGIGGSLAVVALAAVLVILFNRQPPVEANDDAAIQTSIALTSTAGQPVSTPETGTTSQPLTATLLQNASCRFGPDVSFTPIQVLNTGQTAAVTGRNDQINDWFRLQLEDGMECWVNAGSLSLNGDAEQAAYVPSEPTPTPEPPAARWAGTWTLWTSTCWENTESCLIQANYPLVMTGDNTLTATFVIQGWTYIDNLTISADGVTATGTTHGGNGIWDLYFVMDPNRNQFRGRYVSWGGSSWDADTCGARNGASRPEPCQP